MNKFSRDEYIIIRISDYKDNKSIVNAIGRRSGLVSFAVRKHKSFKSPFAGKISKLNIINAELFESNNHNYLNNINKTYHIGQIDNIKEYQSQQKLLLILEKLSQHTLDTEIFDTIYTLIKEKLSIHKNLSLILSKIINSLNLFEVDKNLHEANHFFINQDGIINNKQGQIKFNKSTFKVLNFYIKNTVQNAQKLTIQPEQEIEIEYIFTQLLNYKYNTLINFRNLNDIFNSIQLHDKTN